MTRTILSAAAVAALAACQAPPPDVPDFGAVFDGSAGEWVDLTYPYSEETIYWPTADGFRLEEVAYGETEGGWFYSSYNYSASEHGGTHFDAPIHFSRGADTNERVPLTRMIGAAAVVDVSARATPDYLVSVEDLLDWESRHGPLPEGVTHTCSPTPPADRRSSRDPKEGTPATPARRSPARAMASCRRCCRLR